MIYENISATIGKTPVVKLQKLTSEEMADVYVKLELFNPGGSVKDRIAFNMIEMAEQEGLIRPGDTLVEPTSGNTGIGLAMVCAAKGYELILVMPESMSIERRKLLKGYGAKVELTKAPLGMQGSIEKAIELAEENGYFMLQQFENLYNPDSHRKTTALEIIDDFEDGLDAFVAGVGTGGTITGVGELLKNHMKQVEIVAVEPEDSAVLSGEEPGPHMLQGIGAGFIPKVLNVKVYDRVIKVSNEEAIVTAKALAKQEGILVGISAGAAVAAALTVAEELGPNKKVLTIAPDGGERYLSTILFEN
jgi:cysteine synthase A